MYKIGDLLIYSNYGICRVEDICKMNYINDERLCYVLRPLAKKNLIINTPVDNERVKIHDLIDRKTAEQVLASFYEPGIKWIREARKRYREFKEHVKTGDRLVLAKVLNTLLRKNIELKEQRKKLHVQDRNLLEQIKKILFYELAMVFDTTYERIEDEINRRILEQMRRG